ncbi:recombination protein O N-terminal domain-containing protein [Candidatus Giovannonibacteria bacterium]|nr:recombination protein O N-terminal domain-containing protein [Candidatus Giovannonibacteria bacterium]
MKKFLWGEADFLVRVLTRDFGKIDILAKGARKTNSKLNSHLDVLNHIRLSFIRNGDNIPTFTDADILSANGRWFADAVSFKVSGKITRVLDMVVPIGVADEVLFFLALGFFGREYPDMEKASLNFLSSFLAHEGYSEAVGISQSSLESLPHNVSEAIIKLWPVLMI